MTPIARPLVVVLTGPESTGKTTIAAWLARRFDVPWSAEGARAYVDARLAEDRAVQLGFDTVTPIAELHVALEDAADADAARRGSPMVVRDTDLISTVAYSRALYGTAPEWVVGAARARRGDHYLLCDVDAPWVADHVRGEAGDRFAMRDVFMETLAEMGADFTVLAGAWETRLREAESIVAGWLRVRSNDELHQQG
ncbi:ATP-binding protein [Roseisolibacter agri]|uniref:Nicotinamide-nucleotide adenylyltransferase n=1 Tax=Roseisolibacter agri TaxID=2014610 RepID=A0AA37V845_9BACT|nr:ATP-binding protein [Roseisolibacter agri]GLC27431.1 nicotinamide-nucleotide adenylyltransferase [Roseisolibacter agri]